MKLQFRATPIAPQYTLEGDEYLRITLNGQSEVHDFSDLEEGEEYAGLDTDLHPYPKVLVWDAFRKNGVLHLILSQRVPIAMAEILLSDNQSVIEPIYSDQGRGKFKPGDTYKGEQKIKQVNIRNATHWIESPWVSSNKYNPNTLYIREISGRSQP